MQGTSEPAATPSPFVPTRQRVAIAFALLLSVACARDFEEEYLGHTITMTSGGWKYREECQSSTTVLRPAEALKVERLLLGHVIPRRTMTVEEQVDATSGLKVPSFGVSMSGAALRDGTSLRVSEYEVPCRGKERVLVFHRVGGTSRLVDDFVYRPGPNWFIHKVSMEDGMMRYTMGRPGRMVVRRAFPPPR
jgi:hypothetical protein